MNTRHTRPSSGYARLRTPNSSTSKKLQRPQTSLGLGRRGCDPEPLLGYDVRDYFRRHGSTAGLTVGVNGSPSRDTTLQSYVQACRVEALLQELDHDKETRRESVDSSHSRQLHVQRLQRAPLCWDRLVQDTKQPKISVRKQVRKRPEFSENTLSPPLQKTLHHHMISYGRECIADWSSSNPHLTLDIHIPDQSNSSTGHSGVTVDRHQSDVPLQKLLTSLQQSSSDNKSQQYYEQDNHLCIWFQMEQSNKQLKSDLQQAHFQLTLESQKGKKAIKDMQLIRVTPIIWALLVRDRLEEEYLTDERVKLHLSCNGRDVLLSTVCFQVPSWEDRDTKSPLFTSRRTCECSEKVKDEDTTDLRDIAQKYPDLGLDIMDIDSDTEIKKEERNEEDSLMRVEEERKGGIQCHQPPLSVVISLPLHRPPETVEKVTRKGIYRPSSSQSSTINGSKIHCEHINIVKGHLTQYLH